MKTLFSLLLAAAISNVASTAAACHICLAPVESEGGVCQDDGEWLLGQLT